MRIGIGVSGYKKKEDNTNPEQSLVLRLLGEAIADALLGAAGMGGVHQFRRAWPRIAADDSLSLLQEVERQIHYSGYGIKNIDVSIMNVDMDEQSLDFLRQKLGACLFIETEQINIKLPSLFRQISAENASLPQCFAIALLNDRTK